MRSVHDHLQACLAAVGQLPPLAVQLPDAVGCILAEDVRAPSDLPVTDLAALDGYAVRSGDVAAADRGPVRLRVMDELRAGDTDLVHLVDGAAVRLASGAPLPVGADAVVPLEATDQGLAVVTVLRAVVARENVRPRAVDVRSGDVVLAGFWRRLAALVIDSMVVGFAYYLVLIVAVVVLGIGGSLLLRNQDSTEGMAAMFGMMALVYLLYPVISAAYYAGFESSGKQATLGKMAVGIKVTDAEGRRLTLGRALLRWLAVFLNYITLYVGYLIAAFTERKQGLHDMVVGTLVVDRWAYTAHPDCQQRGLGTVTKVILAIAGVLYGLMFIAVIAAIVVPMALQS